MSYESPIKVIYDDFVKEVTRKFDDTVIAACQNVNIVVDKEELAKALAYDRAQYEKGYGDGVESGALSWIPVSERLPEDDVSVLVSDNNGGVWCSHTYRDIEDKIRFAWVINDTVLAWLPIPEPYEVEHDD